MDFKCYKNIDDMLGYVGFIDQNGSFHRVCLLENQSLELIENWVSDFFKYDDVEIKPNSISLKNFINPQKYGYLLVVNSPNENNVKGLYNFLDEYNEVQMNVLSSLRQAYLRKRQKSLFDFNLYEASDMIDYVGFINQDGKFYRVRKKEEPIIVTHLDWSLEYCKENGINVSNPFAAFDYITSNKGLNFLAFCEQDNNTLIEIYDESHNYNKIQHEALEILNNQKSYK